MREQLYERINNAIRRQRIIVKERMAVPQLVFLIA